MSEVGFSGTFALISNDEWMTIARDIEGTAANWSGLVIGSGHIPRGHSDLVPNNALAVTDTNDSYNGTGNNSGEAPGSGWEQKRTHVLSNGSTIWDLAGNVWEWVDWDSSDGFYSAAPTGCVDGGASAGQNDFNETINACSDGSGVTEVYPLGGYTSAQSFGKWYGGAGGTAIRGGVWNNGTVAGAFTLTLSIGPTFAFSGIGFRCVYRP
jgi:formylglycine-generating enzyme required for sulfatase activity